MAELETPGDLLNGLLHRLRAPFGIRDPQLQAELLQVLPRVGKALFLLQSFLSLRRSCSSTILHLRNYQISEKSFLMKMNFEDTRFAEA